MRDRKNYIDALHGYAILGVIMVHTGLYVTLKPFSKELISEGQRGVMLFFILSSFTLFMSFSRRIEKEKNITLNYFIRRFFRIAPLYYCALLFYYFHDKAWIGISHSLNLNRVLSQIFFYSALSPSTINTIIPGSWTIGVQALFYLMLPYLFSKIKSLKQAIKFSALASFISIYLTLVINQPNNYFFFFWFPNQIVIFSFGIVLYYLLQESEKYKKLNHYSLIFILELVALMIGVSQLQSKIWFMDHIVYGLILTGFSYFLAVYNKKPFVNKFVNYLGKVSYGCYLIHFAVLPYSQNYAVKILNKVPILADKQSIKFLLIYGITLFITMVLASLTYYFIELPGKKIGDKLISYIENKWNVKELIINKFSKAST